MQRHIQAHYKTTHNTVANYSDTILYSCTVKIPCRP